MITHVVCMSFHDRADRAEAADRLAALVDRIESLHSLSVGADVGGDPAAADLALVTTHADLAGLQAYQEHPAHEEFKAWAGPRLASRVVVDFEAPDALV